MIRIEVGPYQGRWLVTIDQGRIGSGQTFNIKFFALLFARRRAKELHEKTGETVSLKVKKKNGRYQEERTYGHDPERTPG